jgi:putative flavoprotein involved in K+ transport
MNNPTHTYDTIVIGAGQSGLATGYFLQQEGRDFVILDANPRIGDAWRNRWDSLRLFTPARYDGLAGMPFPASPHSFPTKDEMADYLETYAAHFKLPVRTGVRVDHLTRKGNRFMLSAGDQRFEADNVVVAMATFQKPRIPDFTRELDPGIRQIHSVDYRNPDQLQDGSVLIVGAGNSGAEIAMEVSQNHQTWLSGRDTGHVPFRIEGTAARIILLRLVLRGLFHHLLTINTPLGRKIRPEFLSEGGQLIRTKPEDLAEAGVKRVPRTEGIQNGLPLLEDGRVLEVANVIWSTGFTPGFSWIDLPIMGELEPKHRRGVVQSQPGLYFVGLSFLYALSSTMIQGVSRDAEYIVKQIAARSEKKVTATTQGERQDQQYPSQGVMFP